VSTVQTFTCLCSRNKFSGCLQKQLHWPFLVYLHYLGRLCGLFMLFEPTIPFFCVIVFPTAVILFGLFWVFFCSGWAKFTLCKLFYIVWTIRLFCGCLRYMGFVCQLGFLATQTDCIMCTWTPLPVAHLFPWMTGVGQNGNFFREIAYRHVWPS